MLVWKKAILPTATLNFSQHSLAIRRTFAYGTTNDGHFNHTRQHSHLDRIRYLESIQSTPLRSACLGKASRQPRFDKEASLKRLGWLRRSFTILIARSMTSLGMTWMAFRCLSPLIWRFPVLVQKHCTSNYAIRFKTDKTADQIDRLLLLTVPHANNPNIRLLV